MKWTCPAHPGWSTESAFKAQKHRFRKHHDEWNYQLVTTGEPAQRLHSPVYKDPKYDPINQMERDKASRNVPEPVEQPKPSEGMKVRHRTKSKAAQDVFGT